MAKQDVGGGGVESRVARQKRGQDASRGSCRATLIDCVALGPIGPAPGKGVYERGHSDLNSALRTMHVKFLNVLIV